MRDMFQNIKWYFIGTQFCSNPGVPLELALLEQWGARRNREAQRGTTKTLI